MNCKSFSTVLLLALLLLNFKGSSAIGQPPQSETRTQSRAISDFDAHSKTETQPEYEPNTSAAKNAELASQEELFENLRGPFENPKDNPERPNVLLIGDSISIGYTPYVRQALAAKADVFRIPSNGKDSSWGIKKLDKWLKLESQWDVIHFNWGLWDICYRHPDSKVQGRRDKINGTLTTTPENYQTNLEAIVTRLKQTKARLIWCATTPVPEHEAGRKLGDEIKYNQLAAEIMNANEITINDLHTHTLQRLPEIATKQGDVHFTKAGSKYLADQVVQEIKNLLAK